MSVYCRHPGPSAMDLLSRGPVAISIPVPRYREKPFLPLLRIPKRPPSWSLDLADIRRTQKRVSALLQYRDHRWPFHKGSQKELQQTKQRENDSQYDDSQDANDYQEPDHDPPISDAIVIPFGWMDKERTQDSLIRERTGSDLSDHGSNIFKDDFQKTHLPSLGQDSALVSRGAYQENDVDSYRDDGVARGRNTTNSRKHGRSLMNDLETWSEEDVADSFEEMTLLEKGIDHEITVQSPSSGTASVTSSGSGSGSTESTESSSGFSTVREASDMWCECLGSESTDLECRECSKKKGHERWCTLKTGVCPDCGKYKKGMADFRSRGSTLFSSSKVKTGISSTSQTCTAGNEDGGLESRVKKKGKRNKKKQSKKSVREAEKLLRAKEEADRRSRITSRRSYKVETKVNSHLPTVDPDIHRQAYVMALADASLRKWRGDSYMFREAVNRTSFSYFPLWRNPQPVTSDIHIGIRRPDWRGKGKLREGMRHVFGKINMSDYYPTGKAFRKVSEENA